MCYLKFVEHVQLVVFLEKVSWGQGFFYKKRFHTGLCVLTLTPFLGLNEHLSVSIGCPRWYLPPFPRPSPNSLICICLKVIYSRMRISTANFYCCGDRRQLIQKNNCCALKHRVHSTQIHSEYNLIKHCSMDLDYASNCWLYI